MRGRRGKNRLQAKGFTLIEIMVAIAVVAAVFVSVYKLFSQAVTADGVARFYTVAPLLAQQKMAEISGGVISADDGGSGSFKDYPGYSWQVSALEVTSESLKTAVSDMKQVNITISADDDARRFSLRTYAFLRK
jgi:general secretion pathway protein I